MGIKDCLENIYYIAFIILTALIVGYAAKTYHFQTKQDSTLYSKLLVLPSDLGKLAQSVCLEVYNHGNKPAQDVRIVLAGKELATVDFIRPGDCVTLLVGVVHRMIACNRVFIHDEEIQDGVKLPIVITTEQGKTYQESLETSALFLRGDAAHNEEERIAVAVEKINRTLEKALVHH